MSHEPPSGKRPYSPPTVREITWAEFVAKYATSIEFNFDGLFLPKSEPNMSPDTVLQTIAEIGRLLGWTVPDALRGTLIDQATDRRLLFSIGKQGYLHVTGILPTRGADGSFAEGTGAPPCVKFEPQTSPTRIADRITKELLPAYATALEEARAAIVAHDQRAAEARASIQEIAQAVPSILGSRTGDDGANATIWIRDGKAWGDIRAVGNRVDISVRGLDRVTALRVLALIAELETKRT